MLCERCKKQINDSSQFCKYCGSKVLRPYNNSVNYQPAHMYASQGNALADSNKWSFSILITALVYFVLNSVIGVVKMYSNYLAIPQKADYTFGKYFGDSILSYLFGYLIFPILVVAIFSIHTKKLAWITSIPLFIGTAFTFLSYFIQLFGVKINVLSNLITALILIVFTAVYLLATIKKKIVFPIVLILISVFRLAVNTLFNLLRIDQRINAGRTNFVIYPIYVRILSFIALVAFCLVFILAAFQLAKENTKKAK
ncbi:MAG: zinc ribbon domain-containing protein [Ruminococcaceae bacterium]|nr:zinc ribbon domain-containing protein [Oscillospiraceae bacterium]